MPKLSDKVRGRTPKNVQPLWKGPEEDGITQSLLSRFLCCRERFRLLVVEGLRPAPQFNHRLAYGDMWHLCEEKFAAGDNWKKSLIEFCRKLAQEYPLDGSKVSHWYKVCLEQFSVYTKYWKRTSDHTPLLQEYTFGVPYSLPSGRVVKLKGKWDSVDAVTKAKRSKICLQENKTKGEINEQGLSVQLLFDLQTMFYLVALSQHMPERKIKGVRYNVVRRPLSGGKHTIRQHKPTKKNPAGESEEAYYVRLASIIKEEADYFFMRWDVDITSSDIQKFEKQFLVPVLEQLCTWWEWVLVEPTNTFREGNEWHYRYPSGVYNPTLEGRSSDLDEYLNTGNKVGLVRAETLFGELE